MNVWNPARVVVLASIASLALLSSACKPKECPPAAACPTCPDPGPAATADAGPPVYDGYAFRLVEKDGNVAMVATSSKGRVVVIPMDPRTRMFADGKEGTAGELLAFKPSHGGCPCTLPACWPYCRVADPVLTLDRLKFWGSEVPAWPKEAFEDPNAPAPGDVAPAPAPTTP